MLRSQGDVCEVATYQALGQFRHLPKVHVAVYSRHLLLEFDKDWRAWAVNDPLKTRAVLIDLSFDKRLASDIYKTISSSRASNAVSPCQSLDFQMDDLSRLDRGYNVPPNLSDFISRITSRSWSCQRDASVDEPYRCVVEYYDPEE